MQYDVSHPAWNLSQAAEKKTAWQSLRATAHALTSFTSNLTQSVGNTWLWLASGLCRSCSLLCATLDVICVIGIVITGLQHLPHCSTQSCCPWQKHELLMLAPESISCRGLPAFVGEDAAAAKPTSVSYPVSGCAASLVCPLTASINAELLCLHCSSTLGSPPPRLETASALHHVIQTVNASLSQVCRAVVAYAWLPKLKGKASVSSDCMDAQTLFRSHFWCLFGASVADDKASARLHREGLLKPAWCLCMIMARPRSPHLQGSSGICSRPTVLHDLSALSSIVSCVIDRLDTWLPVGLVSTAFRQGA